MKRNLTPLALGLVMYGFFAMTFFPFYSDAPPFADVWAFLLCSNGEHIESLGSFSCRDPNGSTQRTVNAEMLGFQACAFGVPLILGVILFPISLVITPKRRKQDATEDEEGSQAKAERRGRFFLLSIVAMLGGFGAGMLFALSLDSSPYTDVAAFLLCSNGQHVEEYACVDADGTLHRDINDQTFAVGLFVMLVPIVVGVNFFLNGLALNLAHRRQRMKADRQEKAEWIRALVILGFSFIMFGALAGGLFPGYAKISPFADVESSVLCSYGEHIELGRAGEYVCVYEDGASKRNVERQMSAFELGSFLIPALLGGLALLNALFLVLKDRLRPPSPD